MIIITSPIRDKEYCLNDYLSALTNQKFPKKEVAFYFIENNSRDNTLEILKAFKDNNEKYYHSIEVEHVFFEENKPLGHHEWTKQRLTNLGRLRDKCLAKTEDFSHNFMVDGDVMLNTNTLQRLQSLNKPIIGTILFSTWDKYAEPTVNYSFELSRDRYTGLPGKQRFGTFEVAIVYANWLIENEVAKNVKFSPKKEEEGIMEFKIFSKNARELGYSQWVDTMYPARHMEVTEYE